MWKGTNVHCDICGKTDDRMMRVMVANIVCAEICDTHKGDIIAHIETKLVTLPCMMQVATSEDSSEDISEAIPIREAKLD